MPGGLLQETENRRISQISDLKSGHGCLEIELVIRYKRVFETFIFNWESGHFWEVVAYEKWSLWESWLYYICRYKVAERLTPNDR